MKRIEKFNPILNSFITITKEQAIDEAYVMENELRKGNYLGPLHGIPFSIKDNISYGETDQDILSEWPNDELDEWGFDDIFDNENESEEVKIKTEIPFTMTHYLISFPPEKLIDIQPFLEKIMQFDGIEIETGSN